MTARSLPESVVSIKRREPSEFACRFHPVVTRIMQRIEEERSMTWFSTISELCESEIERILATELLDLFCPEYTNANCIWPVKGECLSLDLEVFNGWIEKTLPDVNPRAAIICQQRIETIRVDFLIIAAALVQGTPKRTMLVIECDGHDYHERTKEQARRDRKRDRGLTAAGIPFLRFTGSEIWKDAHACMREAENLLWRAMFGEDCRLRELDD